MQEKQRGAPSEETDRALAEFNKRWDREFGPELSSRRKWVTAVLFFAVFFGLIALAFLSVPK